MKRENHWRFREDPKEPVSYREIETDAILSGIYSIFFIAVIYGIIALFV